MMISKIADQHLSRQACIYIRQSTMGQVRFNQESTERQYNLASKAQSLGWSSERIRILDRDLGQSGARTTNREDFKALVSDVAMGQVGAIFSLEASRLARSNQDWHRLLELCAITSTLVIDEDGCYDPAEFNDGLVLGMKGTFAQAELHIIRARLHGGKINKAHKGELHFALPVGFLLCAVMRPRSIERSFIVVENALGALLVDADRLECNSRHRRVHFEHFGERHGVRPMFQNTGL